MKRKGPTNEELARLMLDSDEADPVPVATKKPAPLEEEEEDSVDKLFLANLEEGDPADPRYAPPPPPVEEDIGKEEEDDLEEFKAINKIQSEKARSAALAAFLNDRAEREKKRAAAPPPPPKEKEEASTTTKKQGEVELTKKPGAGAVKKSGGEDQEPDGEVNKVFFPHRRDRERITNYVYCTVVSLVIGNGVFGTPISDAKHKVIDKDLFVNQMLLFYNRFKTFRTQLLGVLGNHFKANPTVKSIIDAMDGCKLITSNTTKPLFTDGAPIYCAWSGTEIETATDVRSLSLVPVKGSWSQTTVYEDLHGVMFHVHSRYVNVFRCIHTVLFFADYANEEIQKAVQGLRKTLPATLFEWNATTEGEWRAMTGLSRSGTGGSETPPIPLSAAEKKKKQPLLILVKTLQDTLVGCVNVLRSELGPSAENAFVVSSQ